MDDVDPARLRLLIDAVADPAIVLLDADGRVTTWGHGAGLLFGHAAGEIVGRSAEALYSDEDRRLDRPRRLLGHAAARGQVEDEGWRQRKDGSRFWAEAILSALRDAGGALLGFAMVLRDLTDRRVADDALRASEERFRLMLDAVEDYAIFMLDPGGRVATWNAGARRIKGYEAAEIIGRSFTCFYTADDIAARAPARLLADAEREGIVRDEGWRVRRDGSTFWAAVVITPVHGPAGPLLGYVKVTRDLTATRRAEEERLRLARAEEAIRLRDEFMLVAAHELRTPLTALQLQLTSLLRAVGADGPLRTRADRALRAGARLGDLVESLLDVTRLDGAPLALALEDVDLAALLAGVVAELSRPELALDAREPLVGRWDRARLEQVLHNVVENALKYGAGRPVEITLVRDAGDAVLRVRDHGPGIAAEDVELIFSRFGRAAPVRHYGGLGLGLYLSRCIVEAHGGVIAVQNAPGGGALFTVRLPLDQPEA